MKYKKTREKEEERGKRGRNVILYGRDMKIPKSRDYIFYPFISLAGFS